jgi:hypothetical protein
LFIDPTIDAAEQNSLSNAPLTKADALRALVIEKDLHVQMKRELQKQNKPLQAACFFSDCAI